MRGAQEQGGVQSGPARGMGRGLCSSSRAGGWSHPVGMSPRHPQGLVLAQAPMPLLQVGTSLIYPHPLIFTLWPPQLP